MGKKRYHHPSQKSPAPRLIVSEEKANPAYTSLVSFAGLPVPVQMPRNYRSFAKEGFANEPVLYKVIHYIIQNGAAIPPKLYTDATMKTEIEKHPLLDKLAHPNPEQSGVDYREAVLGYFLIAANSYQYAIRKGIAGPPDELWTLQPDKVEILPDKTRGIVGYNYTDWDATMNPIDPRNIGRMRTWNPNDPIYGMSPIEPGAILVDQQTAARKWNLALLQNHGKPPGVWTSPVAMSKPDRDALEAKINGKYQGYSNAGKVPVLDGGLTYTQTAVPPSEMDWLKSMQANTASLANLYDISPQLVGDTSASTYQNMQQAKVASYTEAIFPALDKLYALWNYWLVPMYPDLVSTVGGAYLYYDKTSVEVIQEMIQAQLDAQAQRAVTSYQQGACTYNQAQEMQGFPSIGSDGDVIRLGQVLVPIDKIMDYAEQSMTKPAAPPMPAPEPILPAPLPGQPPALPPANGEPPAKPEPPAKTPPQDDADEPPVPPKATAKKSMQRKASADDNDNTVTYYVWNCDPGACDFCLLNDGCVVAEGEAFPNGCTSPNDSHKFCKCGATILELPAGVNIDAISNGELLDGDKVDMPNQRDTITGDGESTSFDTSLPITSTPTITVNGDSQVVAKLGKGEAPSDTADWYWIPGKTAILQGTNGDVLSSGDALQIHYGSTLTMALLLALFAAGVIESRHAKDVADRNARLAAQDDADDSDDDDSDVDYAKARITAIAERRQRREQFRKFRIDTLG